MKKAIQPTATSQLTTSQKAQLPLAEATEIEDEKANNNLYVRGLPLDIDGDTDPIRIRRICARFGRITSFKLIQNPKFSTNIAYVAYKYAPQAEHALNELPYEPEFRLEDTPYTEEGEIRTNVNCDWHKYKKVKESSPKQEPEA